MTIDGIEYLDPETINGLNLYSYCANNPVTNIDPNGNFFITSFLVGLGLAALVGSSVGAVAYTISEVVSYTITGEWNWSWGMFVGAMVGGAVGGALSFAIPGLGVVGSSFITGFLSESIGMGFQNIFEGTDHSLGKILASSMVAGILSAFTARVTTGLKIPGITGRGSISQVSKQINTKLYNGTIKHISLRTLSKIFIYESYYSVFNILADIFNNVFDFYSNSRYSRNLN